MQYNVNNASIKYAQTFLCISYSSYDTFNAISNQIRYMKPRVYRYWNQFDTKSINNFTEILNKHWLSNMSLLSFKTININNAHASSFNILHFAKSGNWNNSLYENFVSPTLNYSFKWETWRRNQSKKNPEEPNFYKPQYAYNEINVKSVTFGDGTRWKYTDDHGKSGIAIMDVGCNNDTFKPWACVGDINRMYSQYLRGGGTACFMHFGLWSAFNSAFNSDDNSNNHI